MVKMDVHIISREMVKPSSPTIHLQKPYKLCIFDQLTPTTYVPAIFFYHKPNSKPTLTDLKNSLSETLNLFHPLSGRTNDNIIIDHFEKGVPFIEARANYTLSEYLKHHEIESYNQFLAQEPFLKEEEIESPFLAFQFTFFTCGGIAFGCSASHKIIDGQSINAFADAWAATYYGQSINAFANAWAATSYGYKIERPNLEEASMFFPSRTSIPRNNLSLIENICFTEGNFVTKRFVFDAKSIATLRVMAKGEREDMPTRFEALSGFIWKCYMSASRALSAGSPKPSVVLQAVNLRPRTKPPMSNTCIGNLFWVAISVANLAADEDELELSNLVNILSEGISPYNEKFVATLQGEEGFQAISDKLNQIETIFELEKPDIFGFSNWSDFGFYRIDFGWGKPTLIGLVGKVGTKFRDLTIFTDAKWGNGTEAWITLNQEKMSVLEHDPEFLTFASPNPKFSSL